MPRQDKDDGTTTLGRDERYSVSGYVTLEVEVYFKTFNEPDSYAFQQELREAIECLHDYTIEGEDLHFEVERYDDN